MAEKRFKVDVNTPVPLILESLQSNMGWKILEQRLLDIRDAYQGVLISKPATTDPREIQRIMGIMEGLNRVLRDPHLLEREWRALRKAEEKKRQTERMRAAAYAQPDDE